MVDNVDKVQKKICFPILVTCSTLTSPCIAVKWIHVWLSNVRRYETANATQIKELSKRIDSEFIELAWMMGHPLQDMFLIRTRISSSSENSAARPTTMVHMSRNVPSRRNFSKINRFCFSMYKKCTTHQCQE